jgi:hypothetical protein
MEVKLKAPKLTVKRSELSSWKMAAGNEKTITQVIFEGRVRDWVGIGWIDMREATSEDFATMPVVVD